MSRRCLERACSAWLCLACAATRCMPHRPTQCATRALFYRTFTLHDSSLPDELFVHKSRSGASLSGASERKVTELLQQLKERKQPHHSAHPQRPLAAMDELFRTSTSTPAAAEQTSSPASSSLREVQQPRQTLSLADMPSLSLADCFDEDNETSGTESVQATTVRPMAAALRDGDALYGMEDWSETDVGVGRSEEGGVEEMTEYDMDEATSATTEDYTSTGDDDDDDGTGVLMDESSGTVSDEEADEVTEEWPTSATTSSSSSSSAALSSSAAAREEVGEEGEDSMQAMELLEADELDTIAPVHTATRTLEDKADNDMSGERLGSGEAQTSDFDDRAIASAELQSVGDSFVSAAKGSKSDAA